MGVEDNDPKPCLQFVGSMAAMRQYSQRVLEVPLLYVMNKQYYYLLYIMNLLFLTKFTMKIVQIILVTFDDIERFDYLI